MWIFVVAAAMGLAAAAAAGFFLASMKKILVVLAVVIAVFLPAVMVAAWNYTYRKKGVLGFLRRFPDSELRNAVDGQFVKVTGVISHSLNLVFLVE